MPGEEITHIDLSDDEDDKQADFKPTQQLSNVQTTTNVKNAENNGAQTIITAIKTTTPAASESKELSKPLSPYARFFQDIVCTIKKENPNCTFAELRRIVFNMWEALDDTRKQAYLDNKDNSNINIKQTNVNSVTTNGQQSPDNTTSATAANNTNSTTTVINTTENSSQPNNKTTVSKHKGTASSHSDGASNDNIQKQQTCIRVGCNKPAIVSPDWEDEYCSNDCVVLHCRNVFSTWAAECKKEHAGT